MASAVLNATHECERPSRRMVLGGTTGMIVMSGMFLAAAGCEPPAAPVDAGIEIVRIGDRDFKLELSLSRERRRIGLGGRTTLADDEGMLFAFPRAESQRFWMYDCLMDIDIAYLDPIGYVTAVHTMRKEPPRRPDEDELDYQARLPGYPSLYPAQFVIELAPGMFDRLGIEAGDRIEIDADRLKMLGEASEDEF